MKTIAKRILSLITVVCLAFIGVFTAPTRSAKAAEAEEAWTLVTDASNLAVGDTVFIAAKDSAVALSTNQKSNNRGQTTITKDTANNTATLTSDVQQLTLEAGTKDNTFAFKTDNGYLYAASSSSNQLKTQTAKNDNSSWTISITSAGVATIEAQGSNSRNLLKYNQTSSVFSCYASGQKDVCIYKKPVDTTAPTLTLTGNSYTKMGENLTLTATTTNADGVTVAWTSSNTSVATVNGGVVTPVAMGTTTITASITVGNETISKTQEIKVYPANDSPLSIATAIEVCELTGTDNSPYPYSAIGTVEKISDSQVTINDGANSIIAYNLTNASALTTGKQIKVTGNLFNYKGTTPEFASGCTYEEILDETAAAIQEALNGITANMSLAYKYTETTKTFIEETDTLNKGFTGISGNSYADWSDKTDVSGVVYAGNSYGQTSSIQLKSKDNSSGIITTTSVGKAKKITVTWNSSTQNGRELEVYGKNTAYESARDLYESAKQGTKIGSIVCGTSTELEIAGDYAYIGLRSNNGAMYLTSIEITWSGTTQTVLANSEFKVKCAVDASVADIANIDEYGIRVTAGGKSVDYTATASSWKTTEDGKVYVVINLGDIIGDVTKLKTEFTVCAYAKKDGITYVSTTMKTYSVAGMVKEYYTNTELGYASEVEHLYNYLVSKGAISTNNTNEEA